MPEAREPRPGLFAGLRTGFGSSLDLEFVEVGPRRVRVALRVDDRVRQGLGLVHGGALVTLADVAATVGAYAAGQADRDQLTVDLQARFLEPAREGPLLAEALPLKVGGRLSFWEVRIEDARGRLVAAVSATFAAVAGSR